VAAVGRIGAREAGPPYGFSSRGVSVSVIS